jgi:hypothetical protein
MESDFKIFGWDICHVRTGLKPVLTMIYITLLLNIFCAYGQTDQNNDIHLNFVKENEILEQAGSYFNVIRIENNTNNTFIGNLQVTRPEGWNIFGSSSLQINLDPGSVEFIPVRISMPGNTLGNVSYILGAELKGKDYYNYKTTYVSLRPKTDWDMRVSSGEIFLSEFRNSGEFSIRLINRGNTDILLKMNMDIGGLLTLKQPLDNDSLLFVDLPAYADTFLRFDVSRKTNLSLTEQRILERNWRSNTIYLRAISKEKELFSGIRVNSLKSSYQNDLPLKNSPLNAEVNLFNLLSFQSPRMSARVHGKLIFPEDQLLNYTFGVYNIYFNREANSRFDFFQQFRYMVSYSDKRTNIKIADRISTGMLHSLSGNGIDARYKINKDIVSFGAVQNQYSGNYGMHAGYSGFFGKLGANTGLTLESTGDSRYSHYSLHLGGAYNLFIKHNFRLQTVSSFSKYAQGQYLLQDTMAIGFAYRFAYQYRSGPLNIRIDNLNTRMSYLRNSGINRIDGYVNYTLNSDIRLQAYYNRNSFLASRFPYNFTSPGNLNINENGRIYLSYIQGKVIYQAGPQYISNIRNFYNPVSLISSRYSLYQPGFVSSATYRLSNFRSITPNFSVNTMRFRYDNLLPESTSPEQNWIWQYTAGLNYYDESLKISAYYSSGEASDLYRSAVVSGEPVINKAIHFRPYYERYLAKETIRMSAYYNYSYYMPSQRENTLLNISSDFYLKKGLNLYSSVNVYKTTRNDPEAGTITNRSLNVMIGIRKAFDVQQPSYKNHNLKMVGFNDQNGDRKKDLNEKPVSNILVNLSRDPLKNKQNKTSFSEINLITDPEGEIFYGNLPEGIYDVSLTPLSSLEDRFFLQGDKQLLEITKDTLHFLPLIESNQLRGRIIMDRDPNSTEGRINLEGVRVTATGPNGETYSSLTNNNGSFILNLPKASIYKVAVFNVFGEQFILERGEYEVQFSLNRAIDVNFVFREIRRQIQFREGEQLFDFNINRQD